MTRLALLSLVVVLGTASAAAAEEQVIREADKTVYKEKTVVDFNGAEVEGETIRPDSELVVTKKKSDFANMIQHRKSFAGEMRKSTDE